MPDYNSNASMVVPLSAVLGQQGGSVSMTSKLFCGRATTNSASCADTISCAGQTSSTGRTGTGSYSTGQGLDTTVLPTTGAKQGTNKHEKAGARIRARKRKRTGEEQAALNPDTTALAVCERALSLHLEEGGSPSASDATLHKIAHNLPPSVYQLLEVLGSAWRLEKLLKAFGGSSIRVPAVWAAQASPLRTALGKRALKRLMEMYGGTDVYIPRCAGLVRHLRDRAIMRDYVLLSKRGASLRQAASYLSERYGLSERQVRNILNTIP